MNIAVRQAETDRAVIVRQRDEIDLLREQVSRLQEALAAADTLISPAWKLTGSEAAIYRDLARKPGMRTKAQLHFALYGFGDEDADPKIVDVLICKLRKKIEPFGGEIETTWGVGWEMTVKPTAPSSIVPMLGVEHRDAQAMLAKLQTMWSARRGVGRALLLIVAYLAARPGQGVVSRELVEAIYPDREMTTSRRAYMAAAIRNGRPVLAELGYEIKASCGGGGGYMLRKLKGGPCNAS